MFNTWYIARAVFNGSWRRNSFSRRSFPSFIYRQVVPSWHSRDQSWWLWLNSFHGCVFKFLLKNFFNSNLMLFFLSLSQYLNFFPSTSMLKRPCFLWNESSQIVTRQWKFGLNMRVFWSERRTSRLPLNT